jgi:hypothetical protein
MHCEAYTNMAKVELTIKFTNGAQSTRSERLDIEASYPGDLAGEHRVAHILFAELKVTAGEQTVPKHNAVARRWLDFPGQPAGFDKYFDIQNSQALWLELANLIMGAEGDLILAAAFKALNRRRNRHLMTMPPSMTFTMSMTGK